MDIILANPRGFCAGVDRAIAIVEQVLKLFGPPIYVRHEVVHNRFVVERLRNSGAIFVDELTSVPDNSTVIFSAHGVSQSVRSEAARRGLRVFDATCPLVTKVHLAVARYCRDGHTVVLIGHRGHPEVEGTIGQCQPSGSIYLVETLADVDALDLATDSEIAFVTQTTLSIDDAEHIIVQLRRRFPNIHGPRTSDICYATKNRQDAVRNLARTCQVIFVVGSLNSSNSNRLRELAVKNGAKAFLIDGPDDIQRDWLTNATQVGVTAGASAPEILVEQVVTTLQGWGYGRVYEQTGQREAVTFALPPELRTNAKL